MTPVSIVKKEGVYLEEQLLKWKKSGLSNFYTSFVVVKIHVTYIIGIDRREENPSSDTVNSYHSCMGRYAVLFLNLYI